MRATASFAFTSSSINHPSSFSTVAGCRDWLEPLRRFHKSAPIRNTEMDAHINHLPSAPDRGKDAKARDKDRDEDNR